jgi:hypothetical protein
MTGADRLMAMLAEIEQLRMQMHAEHLARMQWLRQQHAAELAEISREFAELRAIITRTTVREVCAQRGLAEADRPAPGATLH